MGTKMACFCGCRDNKMEWVLDGNKSSGYHGNCNENVKCLILSTKAKGVLKTVGHPTFHVFTFVLILYSFQFKNNNKLWSITKIKLDWAKLMNGSIKHQYCAGKGGEGNTTLNLYDQEQSQALPEMRHQQRNCMSPKQKWTEVLPTLPLTCIFHRHIPTYCHINSNIFTHHCSAQRLTKPVPQLVDLGWSLSSAEIYGYHQQCYKFLWLHTFKIR